MAQLDHGRGGRRDHSLRSQGCSVTVQVGPHTFDHVRYDERGDVLYLSIGEPREAADGVVTPEGHVLRYDDTNAVIGITVINAKWLWERDGSLNVSFPIQAEDLALAFA